MVEENSSKLDSNRSRSEETSERSEKSEKTESKHSNIPENEIKNSNQIDHEDEENRLEDEDHTTSEQQNLYEKTLRSDSIERKSRKSSTVSNRPISPAVSRSTNFEQQKTVKKKWKSNQSLLLTKDPYLTSINDMKYLGDQFLVGKLNPNIKSPFETRFEKQYARTLKKMKSTRDKTDPNETLSEIKRNGKMINLDPQFTLTNELKFTGKQFNVGKLDPKIQSPFEKKFQKRFTSHLKVLSPNPNRMMPNLQFNDLKQIHNTLTTPRKINSK